MKKNIPHGWKEKLIFEVAPIKSKLVDPKRDEYSQLTLIAPDHIQQKSGQIMAKKTAAEQSAISGKFLIMKNDVIYSKIRPYLMKAAISPERCLCSADMYPLHCNGEIEPRYLHSILLSERFTNYANSCSTRTGIPKLNRLDMGEYMLTVPPLPEQKAITDLLSTWDDAIEKTERLVKAKEKRFKWLLRLLISVPQNASERMEWKKTKFKNIFKPNHRKNANNAKLPVLSVTTNGIVFQSEYFKKEVASADKAVYWVVENGDFVMSGLNFWMGSVDFQTICDAGLVSPAYKVFKLISGSCIPKYLHHFIKSKEMIKILDRSSVQGASIVRRNLDIDALSNSYIYLPSEDMQLRIAEILTFAQQEIDMLKQLLDKYKTQKRGLMQKMLIGEWRLKPEEVKKYTEV